MVKLNKFEKTRLFGARGLELAEGAEPKIDIESEHLSKQFTKGCVKISQREYEEGILDLEILKKDN